MKAALYSLKNVVGEVLIWVIVKAMFPCIQLQRGGDAPKAGVNIGWWASFGFLIKSLKVMSIDVSSILSFVRSESN